MKIMIITGSPKPNGGTTSLLVDQLKKSILSHKSDVDFVTFNIRSNFLPDSEYENLENYDVLIIATPLYVDNLPSHVLTQLIKIEEYLNSKKGEKSTAKNKLLVYGLLNCGFYESKYNSLALRIIRMWAIKSGLIFASGLGLGGGEMINVVEEKFSLNSGPLKVIKQSLDNFGEIISKKKCATNNFCSPAIPRWVFIKAANISFCKENAKKNGLTIKQLYYKIP